MLAAATASLVPAAGLRAQTPPRYASTFVAPAHWAHAAARRLAGLGVVAPGYAWGQRSLTVRELAILFEEAVVRADRFAPAAAPLARAYLDRFVEEFAPTRAAYGGAGGRGLAVLGGALDLRYERHEGRVLAGIGYDNATDWTGPIPVDDASDRVTEIAMRVAFQPYLAVTVSPAWRGDALHLRAGHVAATWGAAGIWFGRRTVGFGPGAGGGIVLGNGTRVDGGGFYLAEPVRLPGWLRYVGPVRFGAMLTRIDNDAEIGHPWFWAARLAVMPHPRLGIGLSRAVMFGGEGNTPVTLRNVAFMLIGKHSGVQGEFDNQVVSLDVRYRPPTGPLPLVLYAEWGLDDSAGAWKDVPGVLAGIEVPAVPGLPQLALRLERTSFAAACCGNTIWYRNWAFDGGWTDAGHPLGHPLGGHGTEWLAGVRADLWDARVRIAADGFVRDRGAENLFAPDRAGRSRGGRLTVEARLAARLELYVTGAIEDGARDWRESSLRAGGRMLFR